MGVELPPIAALQPYPLITVRAEESASVAAVVFYALIGR